MPRNSCKAGRLWWIWTRTLDFFKPGVGKHRVKAKLKELEHCIVQRDEWLKERDEWLTVRNSDNKHLRKELAREVKKNHQLTTALYMEDAVNTCLTVQKQEVPADEVDTQKIPLVSTN